MSDDDKAEMFEFLDELREGGTINMMGAARPLAAEFDLPKSEAREVLFAWMESK
jgi:hypothetical protein